MKPVRPKNFYITEWAAADSRCVTRMERLMGGFGMGVDQVQLLNEDNMADLIRQKDWCQLDVRQGRVVFQGDPDVVFNKMLFPTPEEREATIQRNEVLREARGGYTAGFLHMLYGIHPGYHYEDGPDKRSRRVNCWSLYDLHSAYGCFHKCRYCRRGRVTTLALNIENYLEHTDQLMAANPWQQVFRYDVETDCLPLEPEFGMCEALVKHYAELPDKYIILFSKSDNVDFLLDLEHKGHTIMLWTLSTPTVSRAIEVDSATTEERIEAARKCQQAGYTVRFKFKPIVPIANWREEATDMLEKLFAAVQPDNLSMEMLFFNDMAEFKEIFPQSLFDPALVARMEQIEATTGFVDGNHPFPDDVRFEIYSHYISEVQRLSPGTRVALCAETSEMWARLGERMGCGEHAFTCNCGPVALPGLDHDRIASTDDGKAIVV